MTSFDVMTNESSVRGAVASSSPISSSEKPPLHRRDVSQAGQARGHGTPSNGSLCSSLSPSQGSSTMTSASASHSSASPQLSSGTSQSTPSCSGKQRIEPAEMPPPRPKRIEKLPLHCHEPDCNQTLACPYDLKCHLEDVHGQCQYVYRCNEPSCGRVRSRKDKVKDHCEKMRHHRHGFARIYVGEAQNADVLEAMRRQRSKKKGRRQESSCESCGR